MPKNAIPDGISGHTHFIWSWQNTDKVDLRKNASGQSDDFLEISKFFVFTRESIAIARISYGNSVCPSVCPSVTIRYQSNTRCNRDFGVSPYDSLESLVFRDKSSCRKCLVVGVDS